jgi:hypothetical protein
MKYYYTYKVQCTAVGWEDYYYLGKHETTNLNDGYKGSGNKLREYYKQYPEDYIFTILEFYSNKTELNIAEQKLISDLWKTDEYCLNSTSGGHGSWSAAHEHRKGKHVYMSETHKANLSKALKGKQYSEESKRKMSESHKGKHLTIETKNKLSELLKGRKKPNFTDDHKRKLSESHKGKPSAMKGKQHSEESKQKNKYAHLGKKQSAETKLKRSQKLKGRVSPNKGKHWKLDKVTGKRVYF